MRNIEQLNISESSFKIFKNIVKWKQWDNKVILNWLNDEIKECYALYESQKEELFSISPKSYTWINKEALLHCYNSDILYTENIKKRIKQLDWGKCPYCNIDSSRQIEHYIPKGHFPEYAFLKENLIPSCGLCNSIKWEQRKDTYTRLFLNAYFDSIPTEQFLFVRLSIANKTINTDFYIDTSDIIINKHLEKILIKHMNKLKLSARYSEEVNVNPSELRYRLKKTNNLTIIEIKELIINEYELKVEFYWNNYWEAVLYKAISENNEIIEFLMKEDL